jgi:conjugative transfer region protein TrbK
MNPARIASVAILGLAAVGAAHVVVRQPSIAVAQSSSSNPLAKALERCLQLGERSETDRDCEAAYAENRARFFTPPAPYVPGNADLFPNKRPLTNEEKPASPARER